MIVKLATIVFVFLTIIPRDTVAQGCVDCAANCSMTTDGENFDDLFCSCPDSKNCQPIGVCTSCYFGGSVWCYDDFNQCGGIYDDTFSVNCGCDFIIV